MTKAQRDPGPHRDERPPLLLYDGLCGLCDGAVRLVLRHDRLGTLRFAPLHGPTAHAILARRPDLGNLDTLVFLPRLDEPEGARVRSDAVLALAEYLGAPWSAARILGLIPRSLLDRGYDGLARHRYRMFGRFDACPAPAPEDAVRFLP